MSKPTEEEANLIKRAAPTLFIDHGKYRNVQQQLEEQGRREAAAKKPKDETVVYDATLLDIIRKRDEDIARMRSTPAKWIAKQCEICNASGYVMREEPDIFLNSQNIRSYHLCDNVPAEKIGLAMKKMFQFLRKEIESKKEKNPFGYE